MRKSLSIIVMMLTSVAIGWAGQAGTDVADGDSLTKAGKFDLACDAYEAVLRRDSHNAQAQAGEIKASERLALQERAAGKVDDALKALLQAESYVPDSSELLYDLGILEDEMGLFMDADRSLTRLMSLEGASVAPEVLYAVGRVKLDLGQLGPAEEEMLAYLKLKPEDASAHFGLGRVYRQGLQFDKAILEFKRCIILQPTQTEGYYELGDAELEAGNYDEARVEFEKTLKRNPKHGGALTGMGIVYFKEKRYGPAREALLKAAAAAPNYQPAHYYLGLTLARLGLQADSHKELEVATRLAEEDRKRLANRLVLKPQEP